MLRKKASLEVQFNWIFVLVAGALILLFFFAFINKMIKSNDYETVVEVRTKMNALMSSAKDSPGTLIEASLKDVSLETESIVPTCGKGLYINGDRNLRMDMGTFFSPDLIESRRNKVFLWTMPWRVPFEITNFLFVTNHDVHYVFLEPLKETSEEYKYMYEIYEDPQKISFPEQMTKSILKLGNNGKYNLNFDNYDNYKIRLVSFLSMEFNNVQLDLNKQDLTAIQIDVEGDGLDSWGELTFYEQNDAKNGWKVSGGEKSYFIGKASVFAAIFSENRHIYE